MKNVINYKGYIGSVEFNKNDNLLYGKVLGINSLITYEGKDKNELINDFHSAIEEYLSICKNHNINIEH